MRIITWNIQWGRGADGAVDLSRTIAALRAMPDADVICLQEVAQNLPGLVGGHREDGPAVLGEAFPAYEPVFGAGVDVSDGQGGRARFGNLLLSRLPVDQVFRHLLPCPVDPAYPSMQRCCLEAVVSAPWGPVRVLTTHLEYYSVKQRRAQIGALRVLQEEVAGHARVGRIDKDSNPAFAARVRPIAAVICGDFNLEPDSPEYALMGSPLPDGVPAWRDAWRVCHGDRPHAASVGLHGAEWPDRPYCCDYHWVTEDLAPRVRAVAVEADTPASDHQPVILELAD